MSEKNIWKSIVLTKNNNLIKIKINNRIICIKYHKIKLQPLRYLHRHRKETTRDSAVLFIHIFISTERPCKSKIKYIIYNTSWFTQFWFNFILADINYFYSYVQIFYLVHQFESLLDARHRRKPHLGLLSVHWNWRWLGTSHRRPKTQKSVNIKIIKLNVVFVPLVLWPSSYF